ncbi:hypothetical protein PUW24_04755 [Paenibacillus urinalis]|uniref:DUF2759 family protein n=1 Tax=Paenibacillus urinalis TaxID=521520 RepID=A0AAX3MX62_9BACL|nr:hypothetical protein [Paenibacillus urinalis]WDH82206.1 hypothetical protein PUW23_22585 [Paenibacillus urinalis]WDH98255.1 hypothetical protein PUW24_04755 [Paenibacillus urinalis]WDI01939.1 hypothetical protein PUW25_22490 [Paenibacillus urinalis]
MLLLAEAGGTTSKFNGFDIFVILFTIIIFIGVVRLIKAPQKNLFAIGFGVVSLIVFLITDYAMIKHWLS